MALGWIVATMGTENAEDAVCASPLANNTLRRMSVPIVVRGGILATNGTQLNTDAFSRTRVSMPVPLFSNVNSRASNLLLMDANSDAANVTIAAGTGAGEGTYTLTAAGNVSATSAIRQSYMFAPYIPGVSKYGVMTAILHPAGFTATGADSGDAYARAGMWDGLNGLFWSWDAHDGLAVNVMREGVITQSAFQASFNQNTLTAIPVPSSGATVALDPTFMQVYYIDMEWLGAGAVRFGVYIEDTLVIAHIFGNVNSLSAGPYTPLPNAPIRFESHTASGVIGNACVVEGCSAMFLEACAPVPSVGVALAYATTASTIASGDATSEQPLLAIRATSTGTYYSGSRAAIVITGFNLTINTADTVVVRIRRLFTRAGSACGSLAGTPTFANPYPSLPSDSVMGAACIVQVCDRSSTPTPLTTITVDGSQVLWAASASNVNPLTDLNVSLTLGASIGRVQDVFVITGQTLASGAYTCAAQVMWQIDS